MNPTADAMLFCLESGSRARMPGFTSLFSVAVKEGPSQCCQARKEIEPHGSERRRLDCVWAKGMTGNHEESTETLLL